MPIENTSENEDAPPPPGIMTMIGHLKNFDTEEGRLKAIRMRCSPLQNLDLQCLKKG